MFDIGALELIVIAVVALLVVGPERLPKLARTAGLWLGRARRAFTSVKDEIDREIRAEELKEILRKQAASNPLEQILEVEPKRKRAPSATPASNAQHRDQQPSQQPAQPPAGVVPDRDRDEAGDQAREHDGHRSAHHEGNAPAPDRHTSRSASNRPTAGYDDRAAP